MRKVLGTIIAILVLCLLAGCGTTAPYEIVKENGSYYLVMDEEQYPYSNVDSYMMDYSLYFGSLEEMRSDLLLGNLTEKEMEYLSMFTRDEEGKIKICDLDNLWECTYSETLNVNFVVLSNSKYTFGLKGDNLKRATFCLYPQDQWHERVEFFANYDQNDRVEHYSKDTEEDRNSIVFLYKLREEETKRKLVVYTISSEDKTLHVCERYELEKSSEVPSAVDIYGEHHGSYFYIFIDGLTERPSVEWLSQFGIKEYTATE